MANMKIHFLSWGQTAVFHQSKRFWQHLAPSWKHGHMSVSRTAGLWTPFCLDNPIRTSRLQDAPFTSLTRITSQKQQEPAERCVVLPSDCAGRDASFALDGLLASSSVIHSPGSAPAEGSAMQRSLSWHSAEGKQWVPSTHMLKFLERTPGFWDCWCFPCAMCPQPCAEEQGTSRSQHAEPRHRSPGSSVLLRMLTAGGPALPRCAAGARVLEPPGPLPPAAWCRGGELESPKHHVRAKGTACAFPTGISVVVSARTPPLLTSHCRWSSFGLPSEVAFQQGSRDEH